MEQQQAFEFPQHVREHPADVADRLQRLATDDAQAALRRLPPELAAAALDEMEGDRAVELLEALDVEALVRLFRELPPDSVTDLAAELDPEKRRAVLRGLPSEKMRLVNALLRYPPDTAGGVMSDRFIAIQADQSVQESLTELRTRGTLQSEDVSYLYVVDAEYRLVGVAPFRDLVLAPPERRIAEVMRREVKALPVSADQEEIAREFEHYHYLGLPVVERDGRLVGVVRASDALEIASAEATEDMQLMVGLSGEERALAPWRHSVGRRLPWLYVNLGTAFLAAAVVNFFESTIAQWTALAVFLPVIAGQSGNAGMQTLTVIIRDLALGELSPGDGRKALLNELILALINGLAVGVVIGLAAYLWKGDPRLGFVAGLAMVLSQLTAALAGVLIPFGLKAARVDPALASSIFVTTATDVLGFFFFLGLAVLALRLCG